VSNALGLDLSSYQGSTWGSFAKGKQFAFAKATEGTGYISPYFSFDWAEARTLGLVRGAYHFGHPGEDPLAQGAYFLANVRAHGLAPGDMLGLDLEVDDGLPPSAVAAWAQRFMAALRRAATNALIVYTYPAFAGQGCCEGLGGYPLWIADPNHPAGHPTVPAPWKAWHFHQYADAPLDEDCFNGTEAALKVFAAPPKPEPKPVEATMPGIWKQLITVTPTFAGGVIGGWTVVGIGEDGDLWTVSKQGTTWAKPERIDSVDIRA